MDLSGGSFRAIMVSVVRKMGLRIRTTYPLHQRQEVVGRPSFCFPVIEVDTLCTSIHHEINRASATQHTAAWNDGLATIEGLFCICFVEKSCLRSWGQMNQIHCWVGDGGIIVVVLAAFY
jgi:hypothetical protein